MVPGCGTGGTFGTSGTVKINWVLRGDWDSVDVWDIWDEWDSENRWDFYDEWGSGDVWDFGTVGAVEMGEALKLQTSLVSNCLKLEFPRCRAIVSRGHGPNYKYLLFDSFWINLNHFMILFKMSCCLC